MRALIVGEIVDTEERAWEMNGRTGTTWTAFIRGGSSRDAAQRVRVTERQYVRLTHGQDVTWPVDVFPQASDFGAPKLRVTLDPDHDVTPTGEYLSAV